MATDKPDACESAREGEREACDDRSDEEGERWPQRELSGRLWALGLLIGLLSTTWSPKLVRSTPPAGALFRNC